MYQKYRLHLNLSQHYYFFPYKELYAHQQTFYIYISSLYFYDTSTLIKSLIYHTNVYLNPYNSSYYYIVLGVKGFIEQLLSLFKMLNFIRFDFFKDESLKSVINDNYDFSLL